MLIEKLVLIGAAVVSLGTIHEADGVQERSFWLRNDGTEAVAMTQGYTSCGCTTIRFPKDSLLSSGDSVQVSLRFNPRGKGGEFEEHGVVVYGRGRHHVEMVLTGLCVSSEETLLRQFPVRISDALRVNTDHFDLGVMMAGASRTLHITVLHRNEADRQVVIPLTFVANPDYGTGLQHVTKNITLTTKDETTIISITFDVIIKPSGNL